MLSSTVVLLAGASAAAVFDTDDNYDLLGAVSSVVTSGKAHWVRATKWATREGDKFFSIKIGYFVLKIKCY